jgi:hypothetical protein
MRTESRVGKTMTTAAAVLWAATAPAANLTLTANAYLNGSGQLVSSATGNPVLLTATGGDGSLTNAYVFVIDGDLVLNGHTVRGRNVTSDHQYSATWLVSGSVVGGGSFDSYAESANKSGGHVRIEAGGGIALDRVCTHNGTDYDKARAGDVGLRARNGAVTLNGYIDTRGTPSGGAVIVRSEGPLAEQGIAINGTVRGYGNGTTNSIMTEARNGSNIGRFGGKASLFCEGNIVLAGGIDTRAGDDDTGSQADAANIMIRGSHDVAEARAGNVVIGPSGLRTDPYGNNPPSGAIVIKAKSLTVDGPVNTAAATYFRSAGDIDIDVAENVTIGGHICSRLRAFGSLRGSPGYIKIVARRIAVLGKDAAGYSIGSWPENGAGQLANAEAGDGDITLTGIDTSGERYDVNNPTNSMTSSIHVAGKIEGGRYQADTVMGNIRIAAVEVQLGDSVVLASSTAAGVIAVRYGETTHGIVTHLVENGVRWDGAAAHNIAYAQGAGTLSFAGDVPYAGLLTPGGTVVFIK